MTDKKTKSEILDKLQKEPLEAPSVLSNVSDSAPAYVSLYTFAQGHAKKYGIEMMGGFYHSQESTGHFADTEENWHHLMKQFQGKEVT